MPPPTGQPPPPPPGTYGYQQPPQQFAPPPTTARRGMTFEANVGVGYIRFAANGADTVDSDAALAGADLGIGGWVNPKLAITFRIAGVQFKSSPATDNLDGSIVNVFAGPSAQYWVDDHLWFGGGIGFATFRQVGGNSNTNSNDNSTNGYGFDLRAGYSFGQPNSNHTFNVSLEINPCFYSESGTDFTATNVAILAGYQFL
jgi:hypothetical protein